MTLVVAGPSAQHSAMVTLRFHVDVAETRGAFWWIDSPDSPSMYATATSLLHCRRLALGALRGEGIDTSDVTYVLVGGGDTSRGPPGAATGVASDRENGAYNWNLNHDPDFAFFGYTPTDDERSEVNAWLFVNDCTGVEGIAISKDAVTMDGIMPPLSVRTGAAVRRGDLIDELTEAMWLLRRALGRVEL